MVELRLLGCFEAVLAGDEGTPLLAQPKRAALLAYLALESRTTLVRRDWLLALFWPDADETHARRALNQALHYLRAALGPDVLITRGDDEVGLDQARVECDVLRVRKFLAENRLEDALALYRGELLPGFHAHASNEFDDWLERERWALGEQMVTGAITLSRRAEDDGHTAAALHWARRSLELAPLDERSIQQLIRVLMTDGNAAAARVEFDRFAQRMRRVLDVEPSPKTAALLEHAAVAVSTAPEPSGSTRIPRPNRTRRRLFVITTAVVSIALVSFAATGHVSLRSPDRTDREDVGPRILIADLAGPSADTALGDVATQLFLTGLQDSRAARAVWSGELTSALRRMQLPVSTPVRGRVARELAMREGYGAVLDGAVRSAGDKLFINISMVDPQTGRVFFTEAATAIDVSALTKAVDSLVRETRKRIGDSRATIASARSLEQVTTPSFEALRAYTEAGRLGRFENSRPRLLLEHAIALDTGFASAYRKLGMLAAWDSQPERSSELLAKAVRHSDRATETERVLTETMLYTHGRFFDGDRALAAWEALFERDSTNGAALLNTAWLLQTRRQFVAAERAHERALSMGDSMGQTVFMSLARDRFLIGKTVEAWRTLDAGIRRNPRTLILTYRGQSRMLDGQLDSAEADLRRALEVSLASDRNSSESLVALVRASCARQAGRLARAREYDAARARFARKAGDPRSEFRARMAHVHEAVWLLGRPALARGDLPELRRLAETFHGVDRPIPALAEAYAEIGEPRTAARLLREYERGIASGEWREIEPSRHRAWAHIALAEERPLDAVRELRAADVGTCAACVLPLLSLAYERAGQPDSAIAAGERYLAVIDPWTADMDGFDRPVLHRRLAQLYAQRGDLTRAERHLATFVTMWRDADAELQPQVRSARHQLAMLRETSSR